MWEPQNKFMFATIRRMIRKARFHIQSVKVATFEDESKVDNYINAIEDWAEENDKIAVEIGEIATALDKHITKLANNLEREPKQ